MEKVAFCRIIIFCIILRAYPFLGFALIHNNLSLVYRLVSWCIGYDHDVGQSYMLQYFIINVVVLRRYFFKGFGLFLNIPLRVCDSLRDILFNMVMCSGHMLQYFITFISWWWRIQTLPFASLCIYPRYFFIFRSKMSGFLSRTLFFNTDDFLLDFYLFINYKFIIIFIFLL